MGNNKFFLTNKLKNSILFIAFIIQPILVQAIDNTLGIQPERLSTNEAEFYNESAETILPLPSLPELPPIENDGSLSSLSYIEVKGFKFKGNKNFSDAELREVTWSYIGNISAEELQEAKNKITEHYIKNGYINSGAIIPDQKIDDGVIFIEIIEGILLNIDVTGNEKLRTSYIKERLRDKTGDTLEIQKLQERLQMLQQNPRLKRIQAELGPGIRLGESILRIDVKEDRPYDFEVGVNNHRSPSVGAYRGEFKFWHHNITGIFGEQNGWGDTLYLRYGLTKGLKDYTIRYDVPINHYYGTSLSFNIERSDSEVVEEPFKPLNIESEADTYAISIHQPIIKTPKESFDLALKFEKRMSKTYLLGQGFSFSPGVDEGESDLSVIRFSQSWVKRSTVEVLAARSSFNFGIDVFDSTIDKDILIENAPDSRFFTWLGQFQYVRQLNFLESANKKLGKSQIILRADVQLAREDLLPLEKLSIGGATTVRGYRENLLTRDNGFISSIEWRIPVFNFAIAGKNIEDGKVEIAPFIDYGRAWNTDIDTPDPTKIYSIGIGIRWSPNEHIYTQLYWGHALRDIPAPEDKDLQDDGVHFQLNAAF
ncbi:MAG: ShlB/FhaC/HecB family hemolysin secretion/activation protein [Thiomargarita sp.]|nr:ShlB/FhaC/HecB family hemolysin secretion/activation protein [Thiomargarita sp.]